MLVRIGEKDDGIFDWMLVLDQQRKDREKTRQLDVETSRTGGLASQIGMKSTPGTGSQQIKSTQADYIRSNLTDQQIRSNLVEQEPSYKPTVKLPQISQPRDLNTVSNQAGASPVKSGAGEPPEGSASRKASRSGQPRELKARNSQLVGKHPKTGSRNSKQSKQASSVPAVPNERNNNARNAPPKKKWWHFCMCGFSSSSN